MTVTITEKPSHGALSIVRKYAPEVLSIEDANKPLSFVVEKQDCDAAVAGDPCKCAGANAIQRAKHAKMVILGLSTTFVVIGRKAYRYKTPASLAREAVVNDRGLAFLPGEYHLAKPTRRMGTRSDKSGPTSHSDNGRGKYHVTSGVRTL